ncbi:hypothetical protein [Kiloniella sp. EL199]|uniref:hypothetical protein n=1 Tax=Kiloniella sp. EL199 TaxID=2107581 RepID=UPI0013C40663|nr:hypothetical protein [Kiloniella sp. EL199]
MPVENEYKFALYDPDGKLEEKLLTSDCFRVAIRQGYIRKGARIREWHDLQSQTVRYIFTYKHRVDDDVIEVETDISEEDFNRLWSVREYDVSKIRFKFIVDGMTWDVDFLKDQGKTYFSLAEVELPEEQRIVPTPPALIKDYVLGGTGRHDKTLSNKRLLHVDYAKQVEAAFIAGGDAVQKLVSTYQVT